MAWLRSFPRDVQCHSLGKEEPQVCPGKQRLRDGSIPTRNGDEKGTAAPFSALRSSL